jgi:hypothetical protein
MGFIARFGHPLEPVASKRKDTKAQRKRNRVDRGQSQGLSAFIYGSKPSLRQTPPAGHGLHRSVSPEGPR